MIWLKHCQFGVKQQSPALCICRIERHILLAAQNMNRIDDRIDSEVYSTQQFDKV